MRALVNFVAANLLPLVATATILLLSIGSHYLTFPDQIALGGVSPISWINHLTIPDNFTHDFPDGTANYKLSLYMHAYPILHAWTGVSIEALINLAILVEISAKSFAVWFLCRTLLPSANPVLPAVTVMIAMASLIGSADLSRIAIKPYFPGLYYSAADAARLLGISLVLRRRWIGAALLLAFSAASHPIMGLLGASFAIVAILAIDHRVLREKRLWTASVLYLLLVGAWHLISYSHLTTPTSQQAPVDAWMAYTTSFNMHWYPFAFGALTEFHGRHLLPFLSFLVLFFHYLSRISISEGPERAWRWGMVALMLLTMLGVVFSTWLPHPFLIKLNLLRASELALWAGLPVVVAGLLSDLLQGAWWRRPIAGLLLLSPFLSEAVTPALGVALLSSGPSISALRHWRTATAGEKMAGIAFLCVGLLLGWYVLLSSYFTGNEAYYLGAPLAWKGGALLAMLVWAMVWTRDTRHGGLIALFAVTAAATWWLQGDFQGRQRNHERAAAYRAAQDWARESTPRDALFCVDPLFLYGWRDYSQRSSFGNVREWLHTSWLYDSNLAYYREGMKRFSELGIDAKPYLALRPTNEKMSAFYVRVQQRFYELDDAWRADLARRYGIHYFVMDRALLRDTAFPRVFENAHYVVLAAPKP